MPSPTKLVQANYIHALFCLQLAESGNESITPTIYTNQAGAFTLLLFPSKQLNKWFIQKLLGGIVRNIVRRSFPFCSLIQWKTD